MAPCVKVGKYIIKKKLGEGAFAEVRLAVHEDTGAEFAVKVFDRAAFPRSDFEKEVKREIKIMQYLRHPNIVAIETVLITAKKMYIVMELIRGGELYDEIVSKKRIEEPVARAYFQQIVDGMVYCHRRGVVHRDLKPENILLEGNGTVKITDFGMSWMKESIDPQEKINELLRTQCGTPKYMAPEIIARPPDGYDGEKLDAWECGMVLYALLAGYLPFSGATDNAVFRNILKGKLRFPSHFSPSVIDLLSKLLEKDPAKRSTLSEIRSHRWFLVDYHGDAGKERDVARQLSNRISAPLSDQKDDAEVVRPDPLPQEEQSASSGMKLSTRNQAILHFNNDTSFKENFKENVVRSKKSQTLHTHRSLTLKEKMERGDLVLQSTNNANIRVVPKQKPVVKISLPAGGLPTQDDEELQEIHCPSTPRILNAPRAMDIESDKKASERRVPQDRLPSLALTKISSKGTNEPGDEEESTPTSFRDRLKSPFGVMLRSLRSGAVGEEVSPEPKKDQTTWFAETSPVSVTTGTNPSPDAGKGTPTTKQARSNAWKSPRSYNGKPGLVTLASDDPQAMDEPATPTSSRTFRRLAAFLQKKA